MVLDPRLHDRPCEGQVLTGINAQDIVGPQDIECDHLGTARHEMFGGVGEVVFALSVAGADLVECVPELRQFEDVAARINFPERAFFERAVTFLDDAQKTPGRVAKDAAKSHGVVHDSSTQQAGGVISVLALDQVGERLGPEQRLVANQDECRSFVAGQQRAANLDGVSGPKLLGLGGKEDVGFALKAPANLIGRVADDNHDGLGPGASSRVDNIAYHRPAAHLVKHLGLLGLHPFALAGGQDDRYGPLHEFDLSDFGRPSRTKCYGLHDHHRMRHKRRQTQPASRLLPIGGRRRARRTLHPSIESVRLRQSGGDLANPAFAPSQ